MQTTQLKCFVLFSSSVLHNQIAFFCEEPAICVTFYFHCVDMKFKTKISLEKLKGRQYLGDLHTHTDITKIHLREI